MMMKSKYKIVFAVIVLSNVLSNNFFSQESNPALLPVPIMSTGEFQNIVSKSDSSIEEKISIPVQSSKEPYISTQLTSYVSVRDANGMLINIKHPWIPPSKNVYIINADRTMGFISKRLFSDDVKMDVESLLLDTNPDNAVSFHLDLYWDRIIYAKKNVAPTPPWIKSYGDHAGNYRFMSPRGMSVDNKDTIYVADSDNGKIVKLVYNRGSASIDFVLSFTVAGITHPIDIAINQSGSLAGNPANDRIWIADDFAGKLVEIDRGGTIRRQITNCNPLKVQTQEIGGRLAYIDRSQNAFIVKWLSSLNTISITTFDPTTSSLSCIGQDINNEWYVGDEKSKKYHKVSETGQYIASFPFSNNFDSPVTITKSPYYVSGLIIYRSQYVYTSDRWGTYTGMRAFFPGADALDISFDSSIYNQCNSFVNFLLTNQAYVQGRLTIPPDTTTIAFYDYGTRMAGWQTVNIDKLKFRSSPTNYRFQLAILPRYWSTYQIGTEKWSLYSINFTSPPPPSWGARIYPVPSDISCFSSLTRGEWRVVPLCESDYTYDWYKNSYIGDNNWSRLDKFTQQINFLIATAQFELKCVVTHIGGSSYTAYYTNCPPPPPPPPSCPFVYTWGGKVFHEDNNIIPQSEYPENIGKDVTDYYRLLKPLKTKNGKYILQIREFENEQSFFDQFKLLAIDHSINTKIDVSSTTGEIYQYVTPFRLSRAFVRSRSVLSELAEFDSTRIIVNPGDTLSLSLQQSASGGLGKASPYSIQSVPGGGEGGGDGLPKINKMAYNARLSGISTNDGVMTFRQRPTLVFVPMTIDSLSSWNLVWTQRARLDYLNFGLLVSQPYQTNELSLVSAKHSSQIDVKASLLSIDSSYAMLSPGKSIELQFQSIPSPTTGMKRTFVLVSRGRYERITDSSRFSTYSQPEINSFGLNSVYPNPFNPFTTISFQQPVDGDTQVIIYDLLGREAARLIDDNISKGSYNVSWDASGISSGIYFCRFIVSNPHGKILYNEVKKLIVTK